MKGDRPTLARVAPRVSPRRPLVLLRRVSRTVVWATEVLGGLMLIALFLVVMVGILDRFVFQIGLPWPEELSRFLLIWVSFLSGALAVVSRGHYVLDYVYRTLLGDRDQHSLGRVVANLVSLVVVVVLFVSAFELAERVSWQGAPALEISMAWIYAVLPLSLGLIGLFYTIDTIEAVLKEDERC